MAGNQFYGVIGQNRGSAFAEAAQNIIAQIQQQKQQKAAQEAAQVKAALDPYKSAPDIFNARMAQLPPRMQAIAQQLYGPLAAQTTPEQAAGIATANRTAAAQNYQTDLINKGPQFTPPAPGGVGPTQPGGMEQFQNLQDFHRSVFGADPSKEASDAQLTYATSGDAGLRGAQDIATKQALSAEEQQKAAENARDFNQIKLPESKSLISERNATTARTNEATNGMRDANSAFAAATSPVAGGNGGDIASAPPLIKAIVERRYDPMLMRRWDADKQAQVAAMVAQYDPTFNMSDYPQQVSAKKSFTSGPYAQSITSMNQLIGHVATLNKAYEKLNNGRVPLANTIGNAVWRATGNEKVQGALGGFNTAADAVATEAARAFKGSGQTAEREIQEWRRNVSPSMAPAEFKASVDTLFGLLGSRLDEIKRQYKQGVGYGDFQVLSDKSQRLLQSLGRNANDLEGGTQGGGDVITTPDGLKWKKNPDGSMTQVQ